MMKLFLDDVRYPEGDGWDIVRSYEAFVSYILQHGCPDTISFDHDLAAEHYAALDDPDYRVNGKQFVEGTGYDCAKWLVERGFLPKHVIVHSFNPVGAANIAALFEGKECTLKVQPRWC